MPWLQKNVGACFNCKHPKPWAALSSIHGTCKPVWISRLPIGCAFQVKNNIYYLIADLASSFSDQQLDTLFNRFQNLQASA